MYCNSSTAWMEIYTNSEVNVKWARKRFRRNIAENCHNNNNNKTRLGLGLVDNIQTVNNINTHVYKDIQLWAFGQLTATPGARAWSAVVLA